MDGFHAGKPRWNGMLKMRCKFQLACRHADGLS